MGIKKSLIFILLTLVLTGCGSTTVETERDRDEIDAVDIIINHIDSLEDYRYDDEN